MALYSIEWKQSAQKEIKKLGKEIIPRILEVIESLADDPHPKGRKKFRAACILTEYEWENTESCIMLSTLF